MFRRILNRNLGREADSDLCRRGSGGVELDLIHLDAERRVGDIGCRRLFLERDGACHAATPWTEKETSHDWRSIENEIMVTIFEDRNFLLSREGAERFSGGSTRDLRASGGTARVDGFRARLSPGNDATTRLRHAPAESMPRNDRNESNCDSCNATAIADAAMRLSTCAYACCMFVSSPS
jgi:hypothetical protein